MTARSYVTGFPEVVIVTDAAGVVTTVPGLPTSEHVIVDFALLPSLVGEDDVFYTHDVAMEGAATSSLLPDLVASDDVFHAPSIAVGIAPSALSPGLVASDDVFSAPFISILQTLRPGLHAVDDAFQAPTVLRGSKTLTSPLVTDADSFIRPMYATRIDEAPAGPLQKLKPPPKHTDPEFIYAPRMSIVTGVVFDADIVRVPVLFAWIGVQGAFVADNNNDAIFAPSIFTAYSILPQRVPHDDEVYAPQATRILQPIFVASDDEVPIADVGWQVIADMTTDVDAIYSTHAYAFYPLYPELFLDEGSAETYPFNVQQVQGGIPIPDREGVLKGSIKKSVHLKGSITRRRAA